MTMIVNRSLLTWAGTCRLATRPWPLGCDPRAASATSRSSPVRLSAPSPAFAQRGRFRIASVACLLACTLRRGGACGVSPQHRAKRPVRLSRRTPGERGGRMKRFLTALGVLAAVGVLVPASVTAGSAAIANGGGHGPFDGGNPRPAFWVGVLLGAPGPRHLGRNLAGDEPLRRV